MLPMQTMLPMLLRYCSLTPLDPAIPQSVFLTLALALALAQPSPKCLATETHSTVHSQIESAAAVSSYLPNHAATSYFPSAYFRV